MALKLMGCAGRARPQPGIRSGNFRPWLCIETSASPVVLHAYPKALPTGRALEAELRDIIRTELAKVPATKIDWPGLCQFLHDIQ